ncbi:unnamed protein product [Haemonchus placei]|uniref:Uncharacterized protein n=1 Tax=Haemonchus placei TaxID=6290 RepID=A0A3P7TUH9_HAEPC|nr:unnamed protein product [Haemonchus placei]
MRCILRSLGYSPTAAKTAAYFSKTKQPMNFAAFLEIAKEEHNSAAINLPLALASDVQPMLQSTGIQELVWRSSRVDDGGRAIRAIPDARVKLRVQIRDESNNPGAYH